MVSSSVFYTRPYGVTEVVLGLMFKISNTLGICCSIKEQVVRPWSRSVVGSLPLPSPSSCASCLFTPYPPFLCHRLLGRPMAGSRVGSTGVPGSHRHGTGEQRVISRLCAILGRIFCHGCVSQWRKGPSLFVVRRRAQPRQQYI